MSDKRLYSKEYALDQLDQLEKTTNDLIQDITYARGVLKGAFLAMSKTIQEHEEYVPQVVEHQIPPTDHARVFVDLDSDGKLSVMLKGDVMEKISTLVAGDAIQKCENFQYSSGFVLEKDKHGQLRLCFPLHESKEYKG